MSSAKDLKKKKKKKGESYDYFLYDLAKVTGALPTLLWIRPRVIYPFGKPNTKGGFMISANHCSFFDPIVILCVFWHRRVFSLATKDLYNTPGKKWLFENMRCIKVDKDNFSLDSFHEVTRRLKRGKVICIFPEGRLNFESSDMLAFKSGMILMANTAGVPILPIYLVPPDNWHQRRTTIVGEPINVREMCGIMPTVDELNRVADLIHDKEQELKEIYYSKYSKNHSQEQESGEIKEEVISK